MSRLTKCVLTLFVIACAQQFARPASAQCERHWLPGAGVPGTDANISAVTRWDPDGDGPQPELLVIAGTFASLGSQNILGLAGYDGTDWRPIADLQGDYLYVASLAVYQGDLIVAGTFSTFAGVPAQSIVRFDGTTWHPLGDGIGGLFGSGYVAALSVVGDRLIAGGFFTTAGGVAALNVASWDGASWSAMGDGLSVGISGYLDGVQALHEHQGQLIAAGDFTMSGANPINNIAAWDGTAWQQVGEGFPFPALALTSMGDELIAGRFELNFDTFEFWGIVSRFDGTSWQSIGDILPGTGNFELITSLRVYNGELYAGGDFGINFLDGGSLFDLVGIARWDGTAWRDVDGGLSGFAIPFTGARRLEEFGGRLIAVGGFGNADSIAAFNIAAWNGSEWSAFAHGTDGLVSSFARYRGDLIAGGGFTTIAGAQSRGLARWDDECEDDDDGGVGGRWRAFEPPINSFVGKLTVYDGELVAAGVDLPGQLARLRHHSWRPLGSGVEGGALGVNALAVYRGELIVGGDFTSAGGNAVSGLAAWNGRRWRSMGDLVTDPALPFFAAVEAMTVYRGDLIVFGTLTSVNGVAVNHIARFDGRRWRPLGDGVSSQHQLWPMCLAVWNGELIAGGQLDLAGTGRNAVAWNGRSWRTLGSLPPLALALSVVDHQLIAGGLGFPGVETVFTWSGTEWLPITGGPTTLAQTPLIPQVHALAGFDEQLFAGGGFTHVGEDPSAFVARAVSGHRSTPGVFHQQPSSAAPWVQLTDADHFEILDVTGQPLSKHRFFRPKYHANNGASLPDWDALEELSDSE